MKKFFYDNNKLSMGRLLSFILFFICVGMWILLKIKGAEVTDNDMNLIKWGWIAAIGGKAVQKFAEKTK